MGATAVPPPDGASEHAGRMAHALEHRRHQRYDEAIRAYEAVLERDPDRDDARYMLADLCRERGDGALAKTHILEALDLTGWKSALYRRFLSAILDDEAIPAGSDPVPGPGSRNLAEWAERPTPVDFDTPLVTVVVPVEDTHRTSKPLCGPSSDRPIAGWSWSLSTTGPTIARPMRFGDVWTSLRSSSVSSPRARRGAPETINEAAGLASGTSSAC